MNILIVGEFSAFAKELKSGFKKLGHNCIIFSWGDGNKKIEEMSDDYSLNYVANKGKVIRLVSRFFMHLRTNYIVTQLSKKWQADIVLIINPVFVRPSFAFRHIGMTRKMIFKLASKDTIFALSACGGDYIWSISLDDLKIKYKSGYYKYTERNIIAEKKRFERVNEFVDLIIPTHYDYAERYRRHQEIVGGKPIFTIPLPINCSSLYSNNKVADSKIVIFLGKMRKSKGYDSMNNAVNYIIKKYPNVVRIPDKFLPLEQYLSELSKSNIVIDQCASYSYGMNTLFGMAMGKCVLTSVKPECLKEYSIEECPLIDISDDEKNIIDALEKLIGNPKSILEYGAKCRRFVERYHDSEVIAKKYMKVFAEYSRLEI